MNAPLDIEAWRLTQRCDYCGAEPGDRCGDDDDARLSRCHRTRGHHRRAQEKRVKAGEPLEVPKTWAPTRATLKARAEAAQARAEKLRRELADEKRETKRLHRLLLEHQAQLRQVLGLPK